MNAARAWAYWDLFDRTGKIPEAEPGQLDSPAGRALIGFRLAYLEQMYRATGLLAEVAWDAYRLARQHRFEIPEWVLEFLDGVAQQQAAIEATGAAGSAQEEARLEFEVAAEAEWYTISWPGKHFPDRGDKETAEFAKTMAFAHVAWKTGRLVSWVAECYSKHLEFVRSDFQLKAEGREFLSPADFAAAGGAASGRSRRSRTEGILAAIYDELARWKRTSDEDPNPEISWNRLARRFRDWEPIKVIKDSWEFKVEKGRIYQREPGEVSGPSIAKATYRDRFYFLRQNFDELRSLLPDHRYK